MKKAKNKRQSPWPAKTIAGKDCKDCSKKEPDIFCWRHDGNNNTLCQLLSIAPYVIIAALILARFLGLLPEAPAWLIEDN